MDLFVHQRETEVQSEIPPNLLQYAQCFSSDIVFGHLEVSGSDFVVPVNQWTSN